MDIFDIDPNALVILVIMIIGGLKWMMERLKTQGEQDQEGGPSTFEDLYEEARREIQGRQNPEQEPQEFEIPTIFQPPKPPPLPTRKPRPPRPAYDSSAPPPPIRPSLSPAERKALESLQLEGLAGRRLRHRQDAPSQVRRLLASPRAARDAIVLREILGPPKGAQ